MIIVQTDEFVLFYITVYLPVLLCINIYSKNRNGTSITVQLCLTSQTRYNPIIPTFKEGII